MKKNIRDKTKLDINGCWVWIGSRDRYGYGYGRMIVDYKQLKAHRVSYELFKGEIPPRMLVCHTCDNPSCINPDHLFLGTPKDNTQDMIKKGRGKLKENAAIARTYLTKEQLKENGRRVGLIYGGTNFKRKVI